MKFLSATRLKNYNVAISDSCWSYVVGEATPEVKHLMEVTEKALYLGIEQAKTGNRFGDIGQTMHESPSIPHYGDAGKGLRLKECMTIIITKEGGLYYYI